MNDVTFPVLATAARRLGLDAGEMAEAVLHAVDCGADEREAARMTLAEFLDRRGLYRGELRELVDSGRVFQVAEGGDHDRRGTRRMGRRSTGQNPSPPSTRSVGATVDAG